MPDINWETFFFFKSVWNFLSKSHSRVWLTPLQAADTDNNVSYRNGRIRLPGLDPKALQQDINRGLIKVAVLSTIIVLAYTVVI